MTFGSSTIQLRLGNKLIKISKQLKLEVDTHQLFIILKYTYLVGSMKLRKNLMIRQYLTQKPFQFLALQMKIKDAMWQMKHWEFLNKRNKALNYLQAVEEVLVQLEKDQYKIKVLLQLLIIKEILLHFNLLKRSSKLLNLLQKELMVSKKKKGCSHQHQYLCKILL